MNQPEQAVETLDTLQRQSLGYFVHEVNPVNGQIADKTHEGTPASIAAVGLALAAYPAGVERGLVTREEGIERTLVTLRFFRGCPQGTEADATGYKSFYYHFLDMKTGRRVWKCQLSTIDTSFLLAGMLTVAAYFENDAEDEHEIRTTADELFQRADWQWPQDGGGTVTHGWKAESGFLPYRWQGYNEALLLYMLGLGSPTHPLPAESYAAWASMYQWRKTYGHEYLYVGRLFTQISQIWIDFREIQDGYTHGRGIDYFENSRRATYVQQQYTIHNPGQFDGYVENCWGLTASDGPGWLTRRIKGKEHFFDYLERGVHDGRRASLALGRLLAEKTGAEVDKEGGIEVQPDLTIPNHPELFVLGDLAHFEHQGGKPLPGVAPVAMQQGRYAAELIGCRLRGQSLPPFHYEDRGSMAVIGWNDAVADLGWLRIAGFPAWLLWLFIPSVVSGSVPEPASRAGAVDVELYHTQSVRTLDPREECGLFAGGSFGGASLSAHSRRGERNEVVGSKKIVESRDW